MAVFTESLDEHLCFHDNRSSYRRDFLRNREIRDILQHEMRKEQRHLTRDTKRILNLSVLRQKHKTLKCTVDNALETANQILASLCLVSDGKTHKEAKKAVSRFERNVLMFDEDVKNLLGTVSLSDIEAVHRLHFLFWSRHV